MSHRDISGYVVAVTPQSRYRAAAATVEGVLRPCTATGSVLNNGGPGLGRHVELWFGGKESIMTETLKFMADVWIRSSWPINYSP
jgi:hypothetical protein